MVYRIEELRHVMIGRNMDAGYDVLQVDCSKWLTSYPQLTDYRIEVVSPKGEIYFADTTMNDGIITWKLTARDTFEVGVGQFQVVAIGENGERKTSAHPRLTVLDIATGTESDTPPELSATWTDMVIINAKAASQAAIEAQNAAERAESAAERAESADGPGGSGGALQETDPTVSDWAKQPHKPTYTADEVNAIDKDALPEAINTALAQAKESGEFDGPQGIPGEKGEKGDPGEPGKDATPYTLPAATADTLGGVKIGEGLTVAEDGTLGIDVAKHELLMSFVVADDQTDISVFEYITPDGSDLIDKYRGIFMFVDLPKRDDPGFTNPRRLEIRTNKKVLFEPQGTIGSMQINHRTLATLHIDWSKPINELVLVEVTQKYRGYGSVGYPMQVVATVVVVERNAISNQIRLQNANSNLLYFAPGTHVEFYGIRW